MKRIFIIFITAVLILSLVSCGNANNHTTANPQNDTAEAHNNSGEQPYYGEKETAGPSDNTASEKADANAPVVYFTSDISAESLVKLYESLGWTPTGKVAVKISTGEPPASNYLCRAAGPHLLQR